MASPFTVFRKHQKILIATLGLLAMIAFVFLPMILKGLGAGGPGKDPVAVKSNYGDLTESQLQNMQYRRRVVIQFLQRAVDAAGFDRETTYNRKMGIEQYFGNASEESTVDLWLLVQKAKQLGMTISDDAVSDFIASAVTDDRVTNEQFAHLYKSMKISEDDIFDTLQNELLAQELQGAFSTSLGGSTPAQRWEYFQRLNRKVEIEVAAVPVADYVDQVEDPDDDVLEEFFEEHKGTLASPMSPEPGFRVPTKAAVEYVKADIGKLLEVAQVSDEEIEEYYMKNRDQRFVKPELPGLNEGEKKAPDVGDKPAAAKPVEKPVEKPAEKPVVKPAEKKPTEKPAEPKKDEPKKEAPETKKTSARESNSPFHLVSMTDEKPAETKPVEKKADPKPAAKPVEKPAETKPAEKKADPKPAAKSAETKATEKKPAAKSPQDSKYQPLEDVREKIRLIIAAEKGAAGRKAFREVKDSMQPVREAVTKHRRALSLFNATGKDEGAVKPETPDYEALAKQHGMTFHKTGLLSAAQMADLDIGRSMVEGGQSFLSYVYTTSNLHRPRDADDMGRNVFLFWKVDSSDERVPEFEDEGIREQVLAAWKMSKAREIARQEAEKLAAEASKSKKSLKDTIGNLRPVEKSGPFSWVTRAPVPGAQGQTRLVMSRVDHVDKAGEKFMRKVYELEVGQVGVAMNQPEDVAYVVQLEKTEPSDVVLWIGFQADPYSVYSAVGRSDQMQILKTWLDDIREEAALEWERPPVPPVRKGRR